MRPSTLLCLKFIGLTTVLALTSCFGRSQDFKKYYAGKVGGGPYAAFIFHSSVTNRQGTVHEFRRDAEVLLVREAAISESELRRPQGYLAQKIQALLDIYSDHESPYRGAISKVVKCNPEFLPVVTSAPGDAKQLRVVSLYANSRRVYGACWKQDAAYKALYTVLLCPAQMKVYEFNWFGPNSVNAAAMAQDILSNMQCATQGS